MRAGFVRHGQTEWNLAGRIQGQTDIPLNQTGILQAKQLAERLADDEQKWDAIISSPLSRACDTAAIIANRLQIPVLTPDPRLMERYFGEIEGMVEAERVARFGESWRQSDESGIESDAAVLRRGLDFMNEILNDGNYKNLLIVSHGSFIAVLLLGLCKQLQNERLNNLSYSVLNWSGGAWHLELYNCTRHLK